MIIGEWPKVSNVKCQVSSSGIGGRWQWAEGMILGWTVMGGEGEKFTAWKYACLVRFDVECIVEIDR